VLLQLLQSIVWALHVLTCSFCSFYSFPLLHNGECVPFRLTRNMVGFCTPFGINGPFAGSMSALARALLEKEEWLQCYLHLFLRDDVLSWHLSRSQQVPESEMNREDSRLRPSVQANVRRVLGRVRDCGPRSPAPHLVGRRRRRTLARTAASRKATLRTATEEEAAAKQALAQAQANAQASPAGTPGADAAAAALTTATAAAAAAATKRQQAAAAADAAVAAVTSFPVDSSPGKGAGAGAAGSATGAAAGGGPDADDGGSTVSSAPASITKPHSPTEALDRHVFELIAAATDETNLSRMAPTWHAWM